MRATEKTDFILPAALLAAIEAVAEVENRSTRDILCEAVERYIHDRRALANVGPMPRRTARDAAMRILERRHAHLLPDGADIRDLIMCGRA